MLDLAIWLDPVSGAGWAATEATRIDDAEPIVTNDFKAGVGHHALLPTPVPGPSSHEPMAGGRVAGW